MKLIIYTALMYVSLLCLFIVASETVLNTTNVLFWACMAGVWVVLSEREHRKKDV